MEPMFWVWLGVIVVSAIIEACTMDLVSIWFAIGALLPLILSATTSLAWPYQILIFIVISAVLILSLRKITKKWLFKNSNYQTNKNALIGKEVRMLEKTDIDHVGSVKIGDVTWSAVGNEKQTILKGKLVEIVDLEGNKLKVKEIKKELEKKVKKEEK